MRRINQLEYSDRGVTVEAANRVWDRVMCPVMEEVLFQVNYQVRNQIREER
jgi:hypothetical protein